jgi:hypothetical protein
MPNKTIYIKDSDMEVWDRAQKELGGESISSIIMDLLRDRVKASKSLDNIEAMKVVLAELNAEHSLALELHPFWSPIILDANSLDVGYKLHQKRATPDRIMSLIVDQFNPGCEKADKGGNHGVLGWGTDGSARCGAHRFCEHLVAIAESCWKTGSRKDCASRGSWIYIHSRSSCA